MSDMQRLEALIAEAEKKLRDAAERPGLIRAFLRSISPSDPTTAPVIPPSPRERELLTRGVARGR